MTSERVVAGKEAVLDRLAAVLAGSERLQQPEMHRAYQKAFVAWMFARDFLRVKREESHAE